MANPSTAYSPVCCFARINEAISVATALQALSASANIVTGIYFSTIFAPNHKGMYEPKKGERLSFIKHQIITSRNINSNPITDYVFMGLNYQIEHHLFPMCPRNKLKYITPHVAKVCDNQKLEFTKVSFIRSNLIILESLKTVVTKASTI